MKKISMVFVIWMALSSSAYAVQDAIRVDWKGYYIYLTAPSGYCYVSDETDRGEMVLEEQQSLLEEESATPTKLLMLMAKCRQRGGAKSGDTGVATISKDTYFRKGRDRKKALNKKRSELEEIYGAELKDNALHQAVKQVLQDLSIDLLVDGVIPNQTVPLAIMDSSSKAVVTANLTYRTGRRGGATIVVAVHGDAMIKNSIVKFQIDESVSNKDSTSIVNVMQNVREDVMSWIKLSNRETIKHSSGYQG